MSSNDTDNLATFLDNTAFLTIYNRFNMSSELKYRVTSCSSEDLQATSQNLLDPKGKGWQSGRF